MSLDLSDPAGVMRTLAMIEDDLAVRQNAWERVARDWFEAKRERERERATAFMSAVGTVSERQAAADRQTATVGVELEAEFEALKAVIRVLETRASISQSILRAQGRT